MLEFKKALHSQCLLIARSSAGNGAFAVLPKAKKRTRNAVKRVGSYRVTRFIMKYRLIYIFGALMLASSAAWAVDPSLTLTATSDYRYRGISQTAGDWAVQGSFDLAFDSGFYAGAWASNVDFGDDADIEIDWYGGYSWELGESVELDLMLNYYTYPGYSENIDYLEVIPSLYVGDFTFLYAYAYDYGNTGDSAHYLSADYTHELAETAWVLEGVSLDLHYGYNFGDYWDIWDIGDYSDYSIGVSASWRRADLSLAWLDNWIDKQEKVSSGPFANDSAFLFTLSTTFDW